MDEETKVIIEIAAKILLAKIAHSGFSKDPFYPKQAVSHAKVIVRGAQFDG